MVIDEKRIDQRIKLANLLSYICLDEKNDEMMQGMGRTLNVSEGGIMLETHVPIDLHYIVFLTIALEDSLMDFKGQIIYSIKRENGKFESGIEFTEMDEEKHKFFSQYIHVFRGQENAEQDEDLI